MPKRQLKGKIKSVSGAKTVVVEVVRLYHHPLYRKRLRAIKRYLAHVEAEVLPGQEVTILESRPLSARKRWRVIEVGGKPIVEVKELKEGRDRRSLLALDAMQEVKEVKKRGRKAISRRKTKK